MSLVQRFNDYAAAFEKTVETNELSHIEPFFTEDAVYQTTGGPPFEGLQEGHEAVFASLLASLDSFDRMFATRELEASRVPKSATAPSGCTGAAAIRSPGCPIS